MATATPASIHPDNISKLGERHLFRVSDHPAITLVELNFAPPILRHHGEIQSRFMVDADGDAVEKTRDIRATLLKAGVETKSDAPDNFIVLKNPEELEFAMKVLGFDEASQRHMAALLEAYKENTLGITPVRPSIRPSR
jgi:hypothetical protein